MSQVNQELLQKVSRLVELHKSGILGGEIMPEDALLSVIPTEELPNVITLGMSLNFQRNSYSLWKSIANTYMVEDSKWVFDTKLVIERELSELRQELLRYKVALQPNKHTDIWYKISQSLTKVGGASNLITQHANSIADLSETVQVREKKAYPYFSGPKIFNYWLFVMEQYCKVNWTDRHLITVAPDTHVIQASVQLGLVDPLYLDGSKKSVEYIAEAWRNLLKGSEFDPIDIHTPLWLWSRAGFPVIK